MTDELRGRGPARVVVVVLLATLLAVGCGSDVVTDAGIGPVEGVYGFLRGLASDFDVTDAELGALVTSGCAAHAAGVDRTDSFTFNGYIHDLLATGEGGRDRVLVDEAVSEACASFGGDVRPFVGDLSRSLDLGPGELRDLMATACAAFEEHRPGSDDDPAPPPYDRVITSVLGAGGIEPTQLDRLVAVACQDLPEPTTTGPPAPGSDRPRPTSTVSD